MNGTTLKQSHYLSLGTYRKSGEIVDTPVWFAESKGTYYIFSARQAGKIKRLKNSSQARIATCTTTGKLTGDWISASARVLESSEVTTALQALHNKYGWQMSVIDWLSKMVGRYQKRAYIAVQINLPS